MIYKYYFSHILIHICRAKVVDNWTFPELFAALERTYRPGTKTATFYNYDVYGVAVKRHLNKVDPPELLGDRLRLENRALEIQRLHFLYEIFDRKLQQYIEAGLIDCNTVRWIQKNHFKNFRITKEPFAVLTLSELEAGFVVCLVPFIFSLFVFLIEWIPTLKNLMIFLFVFKNYYDLKKLNMRSDDLST